MYRWCKVIVAVVSLLLVVASTKPQSAKQYQTIIGTGPDKWASVWLVRSYLNSAPVFIVPSESQLTSQAISFDTDTSELSRTGTSTTYSAFLSAHKISDPAARKLGDIIHDIEINAWNPNREIESLQVENAYRQMQLTFGRDKVSQACYMAFFNRVAKLLKTTGIDLETDSSQFIPPMTCMNAPMLASDAAPEQLLSAQVPELDINHVLDSLNAQHNIVFIDTREAFEFNEGHIPGAINLTLRKIDSAVARSLRSADWVIAYCVKDFRGYEAARKLKKHGVNAAIMNPYGIKGWRNADLPIVGSRGLSEADAAKAMQQILANHRNTKAKTI